MANLNESLKEAICIDEQVFFGPVTEKERKIREQFETIHRNELRAVETSKTIEDDESSNSVYKSFSVDGSKYDSFDDSLNEENDKMPQEAITVRKSYDKIKSKRSGFYDSLEDVCSLASNVDKCSISCEVENESNLNSKHFVEDSLRIQSMPLGNKNNFINDQVHFDDDSLAILECETTFSDSLEEVNVLESIEIEEINDIENIAFENQNIMVSVEQERHSACPPKNLFETSVELICERKKLSDTADQEESLDDKNLYDSLSNSDFKEILTDSLEEGEQLKKMLSLPQQVITNMNYDEENIIDSQNILFVEQNFVHASSNLFDTSVKIVSEKQIDSHIASPSESLKDKSMLYDSLSSSEAKYVLKDSLEESDKSNENLNVSQLRTNDNVAKSLDVYQNQNALETSVQIIYDNLSNCFEKESICDKTYNSHENYESFQEISAEKIVIEASCEESSKILSTCPLQNTPENLKNTDVDKNKLLSESDVTEDNKKMQYMPVVIDPAIMVSDNDVLNIKKNTFPVDSCHLKNFNDNLNIDKDLKVQQNLEVSVNDKKCQIASEDIKKMPVVTKSSKSEIDSISAMKTSSNFVSNTTCSNVEKVEHLNKPDLNVKDSDCCVFKAHSPSELNSHSLQKSETVFTSNITQRPKSISLQISSSKHSCMDSFSDVSLLQALDLPDLSLSFLNESVIQSKDSLMSLNLYSPEEFVQNFHTPQQKDKNKENIPERMQAIENETFHVKRKSTSPHKIYNSKTPQGLQKCSSFKETIKKTLGTKIPVRKFDNFAVPAVTPSKLSKPVSATLSAEKVKKCQHSPHSVDSGKKTPGTTPNKTPHICKVRNTIFSKVPQIIPSKKYMNVQSPVAQYIKNSNGPVKTPGTEPVLRDCMNRPVESPHHFHHAHTSGSLQSAKKKA